MHYHVVTDIEQASIGLLHPTHSLTHPPTPTHTPAHTHLVTLVYSVLRSSGHPLSLHAACTSAAM